VPIPVAAVVVGVATGALTTMESPIEVGPIPQTLEAVAVRAPEVAEEAMSAVIELVVAPLVTVNPLPEYVHTYPVAPATAPTE
jgi:hypothetical protein